MEIKIRANMDINNLFHVILLNLRGRIRILYFIIKLDIKLSLKYVYDHNLFLILVIKLC